MICAHVITASEPNSNWVCGKKKKRERKAAIKLISPARQSKPLIIPKGKKEEKTRETCWTRQLATGHGSRSGRGPMIRAKRREEGGRMEKWTYIVEFYWELLVFCNMLGHLWPLWRGRGVLAQAVGIVQQLGGVEGSHRASGLVDPTCSGPLAL